MTDPVILVCPCCASAVDASADDRPQRLECVSCGQVWHMVVDADRAAQHSLT